MQRLRKSLLLTMKVKFIFNYSPNTVSKILTGSTFRQVGKCQKIYVFWTCIIANVQFVKFGLNCDDLI